MASAGFQSGSRPHSHPRLGQTRCSDPLPRAPSGPSRCDTVLRFPISGACRDRWVRRRPRDSRVTHDDRPTPVPKHRGECRKPSTVKCAAPRDNDA
ncbi:hypothetical protein PAL_GLEAN10017894 [Pteropus alecto]|uniref:Uncharacterized protein n=1 Tax=Pteropus alecto TaxID=9402 RepID=L5KXZ7_PTEAL|nr:hypothetical protein PAL_GLEAN10017894 [Pteropus alecto]